MNLIDCIYQVFAAADQLAGFQPTPEGFLLFP
jgi:hypothetical protein